MSALRLKTVGNRFLAVLQAKVNVRSSYRACALLSVAVLMGCEPATHGEPSLAEVFQTELDDLRLEYGFPGATAAYALPDGTTGQVATGLADLESKRPMQPSSRMLAASIGKTFVSATVLGLALEDQLDLDAPISNWLGSKPWFSRLPSGDAITIRHLLTHQSGLPNHIDMESFAETFAANWDAPGQPITPENLVEYLLDEPALFAAGEGWSYTDTGYILLGMVIEEVTGRDYYDEVQDRFIEPLGLKLTSPSNKRALPGIAAGYMAEDNPFSLPTKTLLDNGQMAWNPAIEWTGGGLVSTSHDLVIWAKALFEGAAMHGPYLDELLRETPISDEDSNLFFGAGVAIRKTGPIGTWYSHSGWIPGYTSSMRYYPEHRVAVAFQINTDIGIVDHSTALYEDMAARLEQAIASIAID